MTQPYSVSRRSVLRTLALGGVGSLAGCLGGFETQSAWRDPPLVENRPNAVYLPAITEGMKMYGRKTAGPYGVALTYSYPHRFWTLTGAERTKTPVRSQDSIHLMVSLWDEKTGTVLPLDAGVAIEITRGDELVTQEVAYPMLSQQMGFHYGANYALDGEGEYTATVRVGGVSLNRTGSFAGRFERAERVAFDFTFDTDDLYDVDIRRLGDRQGTRDAIAPMEMGFPIGRAPDTDSLPGQHLGSQTSGDAVFDTFVVEDGSRFGVEQSYLYVSARTPYNQIIVPMMGLDATLTRDGEQLLDRTLARTLDPTVGYHYGTPVDTVESGDVVELSVDVAPQVARHDGYETAFFEMPPMRFRS
ncbi:hypothetical protein SAMN04487950_2483 [Halogranum rubrum]|uniref:DUF7350 domain-containing protein n=1 Tax=Halogranum rubrum TaxID=553466 RepID=A0A1I4EZN0_9EURY|nr:iron transporter [Halogranum rubrum]SFL10663.1 hypothetical protein SAMN04487950_2483 [Halogranum rubrum]